MRVPFPTWEQAPSGLETETKRARDWPVSSDRAMRSVLHLTVREHGVAAESAQARQGQHWSPERETMTDATLDWTDPTACAAHSALAGATRQRAEGACFPQERRRSADWRVDRLPGKSKRMDRMRVSSLGTQAVAISTGTPEPWFNARRSAAGIRTGSLFREAVDVGTFTPCVTAFLMMCRRNVRPRPAPTHRPSGGRDAVLRHVPTYPSPMTWPGRSLSHRSRPRRPECAQRYRQSQQWHWRRV